MPAGSIDQEEDRRWDYSDSPVHCVAGWIYSDYTAGDLDPREPDAGSHKDRTLTQLHTDPWGYTEQGRLRAEWSLSPTRLLAVFELVASIQAPKSSSAPCDVAALPSPKRQRSVLRFWRNVRRTSSTVPRPASVSARVRESSALAVAPYVRQEQRFDAEQHGCSVTDGAVGRGGRRAVATRLFRKRPRNAADECQQRRQSFTRVRRRRRP
jgi:hypothetical protein